jgi:hypothetical protein
MSENQHITPNKEPVVFEIKEGGLWEEKGFEIISNYEISGDDDGSKPCRHCHSPHKIIHTRSWDLSEWEAIEWICPFVITATNEGGNNSTGICLYCLLDGIKDINIETIIPADSPIKSIHEISTCLLKNDGWVFDTDWPYKKGTNELNYDAGEGWFLNGKIVRSMEEIKEKQI